MEIDQISNIGATIEDGLDKLIAVETDARAFGFEWDNTETILAQSMSECEEIHDAIVNDESADRLQEEIGDLLHTAISLCIFEGFDTKQTLSKAADKFNLRMQALKEITKKRGLKTLHGQSIDFMMELWREAKGLTGKI